MNRSDFLKGVGLIGLGSVLPFSKARAAETGVNKVTTDCVLIPQETEGPYPLDLSSNSSMFRQNVTEGKQGLPLNLTLTFVNVNNCDPIPNARVDIWHCDKDGVYSGFAQPGTNTVGQTFCRGIQMTDSKGQVQFTTIYPGWYSGRITHIHFQVFLNSVLKATSQVAFPDSINTEVYNTPLYATHGQNTSVANNNADMVFSAPTGGLQYELLNMTPNTASGGYDATLTVGISVPTTGVINLQPESGGQFILHQNYPNPFRESTAIRFSLVRPSSVRLEIYDVMGEKIAELINQHMDSGEHTIEWSRQMSSGRLPAGNYMYQLNVENSDGVYRQVKVMTVK